MEKPLILVTNDDGYQAKGINALIENLVGLGEIIVVAPDGPRSGMSSAITSIHPIRFQLIDENKEKDIKIYSCTGTPVDCIKLGISEVIGRKPDLIVSGINHGSNASICVLYSGTMGAAIEGCIFKVPSIGFSLLDHSPNADFSNASNIIKELSTDVIKNGLPAGVCLNVNIPLGEVKGVKVCKQATGQWIEEFAKSQDGQKKDVYWLTGHFKDDAPSDTETDEWALANNYISIVPIRVDMTAREYITQMKNWENIK
ncbi:5'/3'-nucleotidase SurE [Dysgonomonas sp. 216]|uniref:5'/3'-nucleotidase SurE n=1 Tax=Dysgonomonas sp. 216 TaxID=2302934 RepID=UPI0013D58CA6|nr:5'/3'-nucleotidase SurE [Dysgonomonas sp. 216]NDW18148.1 5'/3'-nucleotidase SurE [Dysgonomonas sp. 216]